MRGLLAGRRQKATKSDGARFLDQAFADRIAFVAARHLLVRVLDDVREGDVYLAPILRTAIERFLASHPAPAREETP